MRLSIGANQQVVTKGGIPMLGAITAAGKPITQPTQFQIVRQNPGRQQFKVLNTQQGTAKSCLFFERISLPLFYAQCIFTFQAIQSYKQLAVK